jgi:hypothetical protein
MEFDTDFYQLRQFLETSNQLTNARKKGNCRVWSSLARDVIWQYASERQRIWQVQVREVEIEPYLSHTFLRLICDGHFFLLDGTGVSNYPEYYGLESEAPSHLQNSHQDWIDRI